MQTHGNAADGADIGRHVFAGGAVAARGRLHEQSVFIAQVDGQAVEFHFGRVINLLRVESQAFAHAAVEMDDIVVRKTVIQG